MPTTTVIVETPGRTAAKYSYDSERDRCVLERVLPVGMILPYDFGVLPGTRAEHGGPIGALVLSEEQTFPGCRLECRVIGAITATSRGAGERLPYRSDLLLVVPRASRAWARVRELEQVPPRLVEQLEHFLQGSRAMSGESFVPIERLGAEPATRLVEENRERRSLSRPKLVIPDRVSY
jgi:inorganic pyrophosphatase